MSRMRSSIKDLSHFKLGNILSNLIYPRENDFLLTYPSLVKINVKNNKLRISSTGSTLWKQLVRVVIKLIKVSKNFIHIKWRINKKEIEEADSKDSEDKSKEEKEECEKKEKQSSSQSCGEKFHEEE